MIRRTSFPGMGLLLTLTAAAAGGESKNREGLDPRLQFDELAVLASRERHAALACQVTFDRPELGFDLRFHSDYHVTVPVKVLADSGGWLEVAMRVNARGEGESPVYLARRFPNPHVPKGARGDVTLAAGVQLGPGRYRTDWIMRDARGRTCSSHWDFEAKMDIGKQGVPLTLGPNRVVDGAADGPDHGSPLEPSLAQPLRVKILLNLTPANPQESILKPDDARVLFSILRGITGQPGIGRVALAAFQLREQKSVYWQDNGRQIDFGALAKALRSPTAGTIDYGLLHDGQSETRFVTGLLADQLGSQTDPPDAIIIVGPKVRLNRKVPLELLRAKGSAPCPIFYLNYSPDPYNEPWTDTIRAALRAYKGTSTHDIMVPRDLVGAMRELLSRMARVPVSPSTASSS
jgi:hypothetical protein